MLVLGLALQLQDAPLMAMPVKDFRQLEKLMMMTTSDNDAEALSALRKSNEILKRHGYNWSSAFKRLVRVEDPLEGYVDPTVGPQAHYRDETLAQSRARVIREAFEVCERGDPRGRSADFIESLREWFTSKGFLTDAQREALFKRRDEQLEKEARR